MTLLDLLRALATSGAGLAPGLPGRLRWDARLADKTPPLRDALRVHRAALLQLVDLPALRQRLHLPLEVPTISPVLAVVLAWLAAEFEEFSQSERHRHLDRLTALIDAGHPRWFADLWAIEEVVGERSQPTVKASIEALTQREAA